MAFPGAFEPDMNPRLTSLTLTQIPRRSSGHLIMKLLRFFELLGWQERAIRHSLCLPSHRSPVLLRGLRHLRLEFEADPMEDPAGWSTSDDLDAEALMNMHEGEGFSFFGDERPQTRGDATKKKAAAGNTSSTHLPSSPADLRNRFPFTESNGGYMDFRDTWVGRSCVQRVFIGTGVVGSDKAVNEYMKLITQPSLRSRIGPASPAQVTAGIPEGALLFHAAWDAMVMPTGATPPQIAEIQKMRDVLEALKTFRLQSRAEYEAAKKAAVGDARAEHSFWSGRLEVSVQQSIAHYRAHSYWR
ncbi:hypothetical protein C8035_v008614 [Colletotrichum spinosum]|uniref:Uncharacterized protein n=1 Tax=Colletotrichum spinosum TaxID=1347390 RepID=A0A4R8PQH3_9PEZI|nr:hypothetical protein C8035_v008614 [Colletotrichum spinosum]